MQDVKSYYSHVFRPDMTTIVIIGRITPEEARRAVEKYFGSWQAAGPRPETHLPPVPPNESASRRVPDPGRVQDEVSLAQTLPITRSSPDYYALRAGRYMLAGAFYATRLYQHLREETGLVYSVDARLDAGKNRAIFSVSYGCDPENVTKAQAIVVRDLREMQEVPPPLRDLQQAKTLLIRQIPLDRASIDGIAGQWLALVRLDLPLDEPQRAAGRYQALTAREVQEAFARHLRPDAFVRVIQGPPRE